MRGLWAILIPTFALGFGVAWWLKPEPKPVKIEADRPKVVPRVPGHGPGLQETVVTVGSLLDGLAELTSEEEIDQQLMAVDPAEIPGLLDELNRRAGYLGLDPGEEAAFGRMVVKWYDHDREAALLWTLSLRSPEDRRHLLGSIIEHEAGRDFERALRLASHYRIDGEVILPDSLIDEAAESGADTLLKLCKLSRTDAGMATFGHVLDYPADFDFRAALDGLADIEESLARDERLSVVPGNLLVEWAKRDPSAAYAWVQMGRDTPFGDDFTSFVHGYAQVAPPGEFGAFGAQVYKASASAPEGHRKVFQMLGEAPSVEVLAGFLNAVADPTQAPLHLVGLFQCAESGHGQRDERARELVLRAMSPELRLHVVVRSDLSTDARTALVPLLQSLGHSEAEIALMTAAKND